MAEKTKDRVSRILGAYFNEPLSDDLGNDILSWLLSDGHRDEKDSELERLWDEMVSYEAEPENSKEVGERLVKVKRILGLPDAEQVYKPADRRRLSGVKLMMRIAAVVVPLLILGGVLYFTATPKTEAVQKVVLASGETRQHVVLPDESEVWLDNGTVEYPETFSGERSVEIKGKAFFNVRHDDGAPFIVYTDKLSVRVLGTEFSIEAVPSAGVTIVSVTSGRVEVAVKDERYVLGDRERFVYKHDADTSEVDAVEPGDSPDWRPVSFEYVPLEDLFGILEERYGVVIERDSGAMSKELVTIKLTGNEELGVVLSRLSRITGAFEYDIQKTKVTIYTN